MATSPDRVREVLHYDQKTGVFTWTKKLSNRNGIGKTAGVVCRKSGYRIIGIDGKTYNAARLAFLYMTGEMPRCVDHKNRNRADDRWENLRAATHSQNQCNRGVQSNSSSGLKGAHWHGQSGKWYARITVRGRTKNLGLHDTPELAHRAYRSAAMKLHGAFATVK